MLGPKVPIFRSKAYLRFVASKPCFSCRIEGYSQAAHANEGKGLSLKTGDDKTFPLCGPRPGHQGCHVVHDLNIDNHPRDYRRELERHYVERMQAIAIDEGWADSVVHHTESDSSAAQRAAIGLLARNLGRSACC